MRQHVIVMRQHVIDQLRHEGLAGSWTAEAGERARYKCEYCDKDMLASVDNYLSWQLDHIIPESAGGDHTLENMALSCRECTVRFKGSWNPAYVAGKDASREELILVVRENVKKKRSSWVRCLSRHREIIGWEESESNSKDD